VIGAPCGVRGAAKRARVRQLLVLPLLLMPAACALRSDVVRIERQLQSNQQANHRVDSLLAANVAGLARLIQSVADSLAAQQVLLTQARGDTRVELFNVQQQLVAIQELTGQSQQRLSELRGQLDGRRGATAEAAPGAAPVTPGGATPAAGEPTAEQLLDLSVQQLRRGSPATARAGLAEFLRRFPNHARTADALFFTGEAWAADQRADSAAIAYRAVVQRFPQSSRAPSSLYKLGLQALAAGRTTEARDAFTRLVGTWPTAEEASLARERLRSLPAR
jgi:tol-pal system protein YbgF